MGKYFDMVKKRAVEKRQELEQDPSAVEQNFTDMAIAEKFLNHKKGFAVSQPIMSLVVLKFLGYSDDEIRDLYYKLVYEQSTQDQYHYVDPDNLHISNQTDEISKITIGKHAPETEALKKETGEAEQPAANFKEPEPSSPRMGRLIYWENGKSCQTEPIPLDPEHEVYYYSKYCFGKKDEKGMLHTLVGNEWMYGGPFRAYYFDAQYDYWEIDYIMEPESN